MEESEMTTTPPPGLVDEWFDRARLHPLTPLGIPLAPLGITRKVAEWAAQWGADQELEACCECLTQQGQHFTAADLRAARRPKPPSLKEQALADFNWLVGRTLGKPEFDERSNRIRRALEALPDDRT
jgi:hypothetical protein